MDVHSLTESEISSFKARGFLILRGLYQPNEINLLKNELETMSTLSPSMQKPLVYYETSHLDEKKKIIIRIEDFIDTYESLQLILLQEKLLSRIKKILHAAPVLFKDKIIFKFPGGSGFKAHQDHNFGWENFASYYINALISIDESNSENGCLEVAEGFHSKGILGQKWHLLNEEEVGSLTFKEIHTNPGDVILFDSFLPHQSKSNLSNKSRRLIYLTFNAIHEGDFRKKYFDIMPKVRRKFMFNKINEIISKNSGNVKEKKI